MGHHPTCFTGAMLALASSLQLLIIADAKSRTQIKETLEPGIALDSRQVAITEEATDEMPRLLKKLELRPTPSKVFGRPGYKPGNTPGQYIVRSSVKQRNFGQQRFAYTTSLVEPLTMPKSTNSIDKIASTSNPYLSVGKIWSKFGNSWYQCSGSLVGKGVVLTSANCVSRWGKGIVPGTGVAKAVYFVPAATSNKYTTPAGIIGGWWGERMYIPNCYTAGSCQNTYSGILTSNDIATIRLKKRAGILPWDLGAGYFGYSWDGYGYVSNNPWYYSHVKHALITTLGFPSAMGNNKGNFGGAMVITHSAAVYYTDGPVQNQVWGSQQTSGSSGGPLVVNFGKGPILGSQVYEGIAPSRNIIVGTISWTPVVADRTQQIQGSSWFGINAEYPKPSYTDINGFDWGSGNIGWLMMTTCGKGYGNGRQDGFCD